MRNGRSSQTLTVKSYLLSLPERFVRSTLGLGAGVVREVGEIAIPDGVSLPPLVQIGSEVEIRKEQLAFAHSRILRRNRLLHFYDHVGLRPNLISGPDDLRAGFLIKRIFEAGTLSCAFLHDYLVGSIG